MRRLTGAIRRHVLNRNPSCSATEEAAAVRAAAAENEFARGLEAGAAADTGGGGASGGRCWMEPFVVDIRYDTTTEQVCFCAFARRHGATIPRVLLS